MIARMLIVVALAAAASAQPGITGRWEAVEGVDYGPWTFDLTADGAKLTGIVNQAIATGGSPIYDGAIDGNHVTFKVDSPGGGDRTITFSGTLQGDTIAFTREAKLRSGGQPGGSGVFGLTGATRFTAKRTVMAMRVVMLGTGTPNADPERSGPAVAIVAGRQVYLVDAGPGVVRRAAEAAQRTRMDALRVPNLSILFLTHLHSDHTLGYPDVIFSPAVLGRGKPLQVYGPKGTEEMTGHLLAAWKKDMDVRIHGPEHGNPEAYKVNVHEISPGPVYKDANVAVKAFLEKHTTWDQAFGYRFDAGGRSVVISGDTAPTPAVAEACRGCDVLLHEVYCGQGSPYYKVAHTSATELAAIATEAKPKLLVLYHQLFAGCDESALLQQVQEHYAGAVVSAKDFDIY